MEDLTDYFQGSYTRNDLKDALDEHEISYKANELKASLEQKLIKCLGLSNRPKPKTKRKQPIRAALRIQVWNKYIGSDLRSGPCDVCGELIKIEQFECGHVLSEKHGGTLDLENLRPICSLCNKSMGAIHLENFKQQLQTIQNTTTTDPMIEEPTEPENSSKLNQALLINEYYWSQYRSLTNPKIICNCLQYLKILLDHYFLHHPTEERAGEEFNQFLSYIRSLETDHVQVDLSMFSAAIDSFYHSARFQAIFQKQLLCSDYLQRMVLNIMPDHPEQNVRLYEREKPYQDVQAINDFIERLIGDTTNRAQLLSEYAKTCSTDLNNWLQTVEPELIFANGYVEPNRALLFWSELRLKIVREFIN